MMSKAEAKKLARLLRLLADRLESDPDAVFAFLESGSRKGAAKKIAGREGTAGERIDSFNPIQFYQENNRSEAALVNELKKRRVPELRALAKQYTGHGKKGPGARAAKKELIDYLTAVATKGTSSVDIFLGT